MSTEQRGWTQVRQRAAALTGAAVIAVAGIGLSACDDAEDAGRVIDENVDDASTAIEKGVNEIDKAADKATKDNGN